MYGQAIAADGVGAYSFARFGPGDVFQGEGRDNGPPLNADDARVMLWRSLKVFCHETGHVLGLKVRGTVAMHPVPPAAAINATAQLRLLCRSTASTTTAS